MSNRGGGMMMSKAHPASMIKGQVLLSGNSHRQLAQRVGQRLGIPIGACKLYQENCGETKIQIDESVRGKDVFILQTGNRDPNNMMMELFILAHSCKTSSAQRIVGVVPYLPYSKQCRMRKRGSIPCKLFADMMVKAGIQHLITMDLHMKEIQGFFSCPVDNLRASSFLIQYLRDQQTPFHTVVVVARHPGQARRATAYAERLRTTLSVIHGGEGVVLDTEATDGRSSPPLHSTNPSVTSLSQLNTPSVGHTPEKPPSTSTTHHAQQQHQYYMASAGTDYDAPTDFAFPTTQMTPGKPAAKLNAAPPNELLHVDYDEDDGLVMKKPSPIKADLLRSLSLSSANSRVRSFSEGQTENPHLNGNSSSQPHRDNDGLGEADDLVSEGLSFFAKGNSGKFRLRKQSDSRIAYYRSEYMPSLAAKKKPPINVVGDVEGKIALIVEDIIDDVEGFCAAAKFLKDRGAKQVKVMCTHGLLCRNSIDTIEKSALDEVIITNTVPNEDLVSASPPERNSNPHSYSSSAKYGKITVVDVSVLLSEGIRRIHNGESMSYLFRDIPLDD
ncbi:phosphoribosyl pyrophosphate synthase-associated protein 2-like isoform X2 [Symsagittifera roscoffensis]|uniref:phosphoribosyl pyrophosphate synthase-associated protein 2-like isoform X2 n=1 Tax=Symsagittifera roscoffensis TaxID=84072 RepID=UPI00307B38D4